MSEKLALDKFRRDGSTIDFYIRHGRTVSKDDKIDMKEFNEAFDVWIVEENTDGTKNFDDAKKIMEFSGSLTVENKNDENEGHLSKTYYLYIKMKETVGNEFQGKSYSGIGVTVYAVQANGEFSN